MDLARDRFDIDAAFCQLSRIFRQHLRKCRHARAHVGQQLVLRAEAMCQQREIALVRSVCGFKMIDAHDGRAFAAPHEGGLLRRLALDHAFQRCGRRDNWRRLPMR